MPKKEQAKDAKPNSEIDVPAFENLHKQSISSASESLRQLLKHTITQKVQSASKSSDKMKTTFPLLNNIDSMTELQMLGNLECSQTLGPVLSHVSFYMIYLFSALLLIKTYNYKAKYTVT